MKPSTSNRLPLFADEATLARVGVELEQSLARGVQASEAATLVTWAWWSRQRESSRVRAVLARHANLITAPHKARVAVTAAEIARLHVDHDTARAQLDFAIEKFAEAGDSIGTGDTRFVEAMLANDRGDALGRDAALEQALEAYRTAGDATRVDFVLARQAVDAAFRHALDAERDWSARLAEIDARGDLACRARTAEFRAWVAFSRADFAAAATDYLSAFEWALASAQWPMAVMEIANAGASLAELNDHESALSYLEQGLALARAGGWPASLGICLIQAANSSRELGRLDASAEFLAEAMKALLPLQGGRLYAIVLQYHGDLAMARGDAAEALAWYEKFQARADALASPDLVSHALRGRGHALARLGRHTKAREAALAGLNVAREMGDVARQIAALRALAAIAASMPGDSQGDSAANAREARDCLEAAVALGADVKGYTPPGELFAELAALHARERSFELAYSLSLEAANANAAGEAKRATDKMLALQVRHATERATIEAEQHRKLAAAEAERAKALESTKETLEKLAVIGQEITATLEIEKMVRFLAAKAGDMLETDCVALWTVDETAGELVLRFGMEGSHLMPSRRVPFDRELSHVAESYRSQREMLFENRTGDIHSTHIPGTRPMQSALFAPLLLGERALGVLTVQSECEHAYGERERLIFRSLCAFGAVALANAEAYLKVQEARRALEEASLTDPLTGLRNRRYLTQHIEADVALALRRQADRSKEGSRDLVFFLVDIDHFKQVNDQYGHAAGDAVLRQMKPRLMTVFRDADHLLRWGGEEFLVVARDTDRNRVAELAERLRGVVSESPFVLDDGVRLPKTCSIGVAAFPFSATDARAASWEDVVELADLALYAAKKSGRDAWVSVAAGPHFGVAKDAIRAPASSLAKAALALNVSGDIAKVSAVFGQ